MFNTLKKSFLGLLIASTALVQVGCNNNDAEPDKLGNWYRDGIPGFGGTARTRSVSFLISGIGYVGTGLTNETIPQTNDFWAYDPATKIWKQKANFPGTARYDAVSFVIGSKAYVGTGYDRNTLIEGGYKRDFYSYDPAKNTWAPIADFLGGTRQNASAFTVGERAYVGLGFNGSNYYQDFYEYIPSSDTWKEIATFTGGKRRSALAFTVGGKGYVGFGQSNTTNYNSDLYQFDPAANSGLGGWIKMENDDEDFPARTGSTALIINNKAYVVGGINASDCWEYEPTANAWTEVTAFEGGQRGAAAGFAVGNIGYFGTGSSSGTGGTDDWWAFDPSAEKNDDDN
jgi:N-acetylneuraminic acid mutarotase